MTHAKTCRTQHWAKHAFTWRIKNSIAAFFLVLLWCVVAPEHNGRKATAMDEFVQHFHLPEIQTTNPNHHSQKTDQIL